jgi:hypothetical protein
MIPFMRWIVVRSTPLRSAQMGVADDIDLPALVAALAPTERPSAS